MKKLPSLQVESPPMRVMSNTTSAAQLNVYKTIEDPGGEKISIIQDNLQ